MAKTSLAVKKRPGKRKYPDIPVVWVRKYNVKRCYCRYQQQEWAFTVHSFYNVWKKSGFMDKISRSPSGYCMVRLDPMEAWSPNNVKIVQRGRLLMRNITEIWKKTWGRIN